MYALVDHIAAVVIGASILMIVLAVTWRSQERAIDATQVELAKVELRSIVDLFEQDMANMGSGMPRPNDGPTNRVVESFTQTGDETVLSFWGLAARGNELAPVLFTWRWSQEGEVTFPDGTAVDTWQVERTVGSATATFDNVTHFVIRLLNGDHEELPPGSPPTDLVFARYVEVEVGVISPAGIDPILQQTRWNNRYRPVSLEGSRQIIAATPF